MPETTPSPLTLSTPHRELLDQVLDKWSLLVMSELCDSPRRFNELRRAIPDVSQKSLTTTLRRLERNGVIERHLLSSRPVAVQYQITPLGKSMRSPIEEILAWATRNMERINQARARFDNTDLPSHSE
ncbi:HxlR family transcriptional regulator [Arthrobacter sp. AG1021]|uniref:winged helix-turn-helix transcriptional regulator n=1 Tax=Arthrobacter sp. AG1021 TaxID=2183908 RepID=UPI0006B25417|nr:helix-turn-helix domain-containing protein [Arthrobacter sp. AG1021]ALD65258.1 MarR family transcriptional regulator [Arthrobacter sp. LS16]RKS16283.1 HxlR family transcriptional regulator [Arthrobacter sp. AG1021]